MSYKNTLDEDNVTGGGESLSIPHVFQRKPPRAIDKKKENDNSNQSGWYRTEAMFMNTIRKINEVLKDI